MTRSVVTGGSGFIGSHVVDVLREAGHEVVVVDRVAPRHRQDVEFRSADITDLDAVCAALEGADHVHHVAAVANVDSAFDRPVQCVQANVLGTVHVLEAARRAKVKRVLLASSVRVYNRALDTPEHVHEDTPLHMPGPGHVYASSKIASELIVHDYAALYELPVTVLRYGIPYGPRMRDDSMIPVWLARALSGQPLQIAGDGQQARNLVYVADIARAHLLALTSAATNQTFNLDASRPVTVTTVAQTVRDLVGEQVRIEYVPARRGASSGKRVSQEKATRMLGWTDATSFEVGMRKTYDWYCASHPRPESALQPQAVS